MTLFPDFKSYIAEGERRGLDRLDLLDDVSTMRTMLARYESAERFFGMFDSPVKDEVLMTYRLEGYSC